jgi:hypothetical protein
MEGRRMRRIRDRSMMRGEWQGKQVKNTKSAITGMRRQ